MIRLEKREAVGDSTDVIPEMAGKVDRTNRYAAALRKNVAMLRRKLKVVDLCVEFTIDGTYIYCEMYSVLCVQGSRLQEREGTAKLR